MKPKTVSWIFSFFLICAMFLQIAYAEDIIANRTGTIKITKPDGTVLTVEKDEPLPDIPSGTIVEVLDGSIDVALTEGFIQVVIGNSVATVEAGDKVTAFVDLETGMSDFGVDAGEINVITGNTTTVVEAGQEVQIGLDELTGVTEVRSIIGAIETTTVGVKTSVLEGATAKISTDAETRNVHVESKSGTVEVTSIDGEVTRITEGESIDTPASPVGEIQTFPGEVVEPPAPPLEEPGEPARVEGSEYRP